MTMPGKRRFHKVGSCVCLILVLWVSSNCGTLELVRNSNANAAKSEETLYYLDLSNPSITQPIEPRSGEIEEAKLVQVEVAEVVNPKKHALTFEVHYRPKSNAKIYLGSFSLYPVDNPGKFIVATQGKVKDEGAIVLSMVILDKVDTSDPIKVGVKKIKFLKG
jgi:hypothetical protein